MPSIEWNNVMWGGPGHDWQTAGEEWSEAWGGSVPHWFSTLYPRLHRYLPASRVLEIAPGFGRWSKFLIPMTTDYVGIDLSGSCVEACRNIFVDAAHARFEQNDGFSLDAAKGEFDLIFSFDSLVHAEWDVLEAYIPQMIAKLAPGGGAFIHHSNFMGVGLALENRHGRATSVSAAKFADEVAKVGGKMLVQEQINWGAEGPPHLIDCLSLFCRAQDYPEATGVSMHNVRFFAESEHARLWHAPYGASAEPVASA